LIADLQLSVSPAAVGDEQLKQAAARALQCAPADITSLQIVRRSLDVRHKNPQLQLKLRVCIGETPPQPPAAPNYQNVEGRPPVIIVGAGPAGLFAALKLIEKGLRPVLLDRGKPVETRKYDVARLAHERVVDENSNRCFGEGGAGAYSDGKLYTRSNKRGAIAEVLQQLVHHGAHPDILIDAHPHIGTDKLPGILARIRETITGCGGTYYFNTCVAGLIVKNDTVLGVEDTQGNRYEGVAVILATGHSARDVYELFHRRQWALEAKPFALGVRAEHPQALINEIQYGRRHGTGEIALPAAAYSLTAQVGHRGVFSFCMCPGGVMVPAVTAPGEMVVNGMSNARRSSPYANAGIVVQVDPAELSGYQDHGVLAGLRFQQDVERRMCAHNTALTAPAQRLVDFMAGRPSSAVPRTSYVPGVAPAPLHTLLPAFVSRSLQTAFAQFGKKMPGYLSAEAVLVAVESRTSSPVRLVRDPRTLQHVQLARLYPCGEGAGYAGGITSSALDGINCAERIAQETPTF
jgi:uncharacterized FAD-dependent dehydrogenase